MRSSRLVIVLSLAAISAACAIISPPPTPPPAPPPTPPTWLDVTALSDVDLPVVANGKPLVAAPGSMKRAPAHVPLVIVHNGTITCDGEMVGSGQTIAVFQKVIRLDNLAGCLRRHSDVDAGADAAAATASPSATSSASRSRADAGHADAGHADAGAPEESQAAASLAFDKSTPSLVVKSVAQTVASLGFLSVFVVRSPNGAWCDLSIKVLGAQAGPPEPRLLVDVHPANVTLAWKQGTSLLAHRDTFSFSDLAVQLPDQFDAHATHKSGDGTKLDEAILFAALDVDYGSLATAIDTFNGSTRNLTTSQDKSVHVPRFTLRLAMPEEMGTAPAP